MIPIIWRFFIKEYLRVFFLCLCSFALLLIVTRFDEIAKLATIGAPLKNVFLFTLYQIPYILPIAIPLSSLLSAFLFLNRLSQSHELAALLSSGYSLFSLFLPLLCITSFISLGNFFLVSEVATTAHLAGRKMLYELTAQNPLILLQNASMTPLKGAYIQFSPEHNGKEAKDLILAWTNHQEGSINIALAQRIKIKDNQLLGKNLTLISSRLDKNENYLMIENQDEIKTPSFECAQFLYDKGWKISGDHLRYSLLMVRLKTLKAQYAALSTKDQSIQKMINKCRSEFLRRYSLGFSPLSFMVLGAVLGIKHKRRSSRKKTILAALLAALGLVLFMIGKEFHNYIFLSSLFFILPHSIFFSVSFYVLYKLKKG